MIRVINAAAPPTPNLETHDAAYADKQNHTPRDRIELSTFRLTVGRYSQLSQQGRQ